MLASREQIMVGTTMYNILYEKSIPWELPWNSRNTLTTVIAVHRMAKKKEKYSYSIKVWFLIKNSDCFNF